MRAATRSLRTVVTVDFDLQRLPYFDPELQFSADVPAVVRELREAAKAADFVLVVTPEYAHGIPGVLKNALEWLICEETMRKRVVVGIAAPSGGEYVRDHLLETLRTMDWIIAGEDALIVRDARKAIAPDGEIRSPDLRVALDDFLRKALTQPS